MADLLRASLIGSLPNGEKWSVNPVWHLNTNPDPTWDQLNTVATAINAITIPTTVKSMWNTETKIVGTRLEARALSGELEAILEQTRGTAVVGTSAFNLPMQSSIVLSLRTAFPGAQGRGRLYFPATGIQLLSTNLRYISADVTGALTGLKSILTGMETAITTTLGAADLVVWSRVGGNAHQVNRLLIGDIPDVQRRRRDAAVETYQTAVFP